MTMLHPIFVIASGAKQSRAALRRPWIAASPSAPRNDDVLYIADQESN